MLLGKNLRPAKPIVHNYCNVAQYCMITLKILMHSGYMSNCLN